MRAVSSRLAVFAALVLLASFSAPLGNAATAAVSRTARVALEDGVVATLSEDRGLFVEAVPRRGEGLTAFARRFCGDERLAPQIAEANGGARTLLAGIRYAVPFGMLTQEWQLKAARALFAADQGQADGWRHQVRGVGPLQRESLWHLAEWFTGTGENFRAIREYNELLDDDVARGNGGDHPLRAAAARLPRGASRARKAVPPRVRG